MLPLQLREKCSFFFFNIYIVDGIFQFLIHLNFIRGLISKTSPV